MSFLIAQLATLPPFGLESYDLPAGYDEVRRFIIAVESTHLVSLATHHLELLEYIPGEAGSASLPGSHLDSSHSILGGRHCGAVWKYRGEWRCCFPEPREECGLANLWSSSAQTLLALILKPNGSYLNIHNFKSATAPNDIFADLPDEGAGALEDMPP